MKVLIFDLDDTLYSRTKSLDDSLRNLNNIKSFPEVKKILKNKKILKILVSKGKKELQYKKLEVLGIKNLFDEIFICSMDEDKKNCFKKVLAKYGLKNEIFVIGNRIDSEIRYGNELGIKTILLFHGKYKNLKPKNKFEIPTHTIKFIADLNKLCKLN